MRRPSAVALLAASLLIAVPAIAGPREDATKAYERGDYKTAFRLIRPLAEQGSPISQYNLGLMYALGRGVRQDYAEAVKWYRKAAEQGDGDAQFILGLAYFIGAGIPRDNSSAYYWMILSTSTQTGKDFKMPVRVKWSDEVARYMTPDELKKAKKMFREWEANHPNK